MLRYRHWIDLLINNKLASVSNRNQIRAEDKMQKVAWSACVWITRETETNSVAFSQQGNYTDWAANGAGLVVLTSAGGGRYVVSLTVPHGRKCRFSRSESLGFLWTTPQFFSRGCVVPIPYPPILRKVAAPGIGPGPLTLYPGNLIVNCGFNWSVSRRATHVELQFPNYKFS
jgi:hypothetical protein